MFGSKLKPLVQIEPGRIVPDKLHLFLSICDVLLLNRLDDCRQKESKAAVLKQQAYSLERLIKQINECGVNFNI